MKKPRRVVLRYTTKRVDVPSHIGIRGTFTGVAPRLEPDTHLELRLVARDRLAEQSDDLR